MLKTKKATKKPVERLPSNQEFAVLTVSRELIAHALNDQLKARKSKVKRFSLSDARLTDKVCEAYARGLSDSEGWDYPFEEARRDMACDVLEDFEAVLER